jgi:hypothetical protein
VNERDRTEVPKDVRAARADTWKSWLIAFECGATATRL